MTSNLRDQFLLITDQAEGHSSLPIPIKKSFKSGIRSGSRFNFFSSVLTKVR